MDSACPAAEILKAIVRGEQFPRPTRAGARRWRRDDRQENLPRPRTSAIRTPISRRRTTTSCDITP